MSEGDSEEAGSAEEGSPGAQGKSRAHKGRSTTPRAGAGQVRASSREREHAAAGGTAVADLTANMDAFLLQLTKQIVEDSQTLVFTANVEGQILYANRVCAQALSQTPDDLLACNLFEIVHEEDLEGIRDAFERVMSGTSLRDVEVRLRDRWGAWVDVVVSMRLLRDQRERALAVSAVGSDVSEARRNEEEARARVDLIEEMQRASEILMARFDGLGNIVSWNEACERFTSISRTSAIGRSLADLAAPSHEREAFRAALREILTAGTRESRGDFEACFSPETREERSVAWRFVLRRTDGDAIEGGLAIGVTTTDRRKAERQNREERDVALAIMALVTDATFVTDRRGETLHWSAAMERLTGTPASAVMARRPEELVSWLAQSGYASASGSLLQGGLEFYESPPRQVDAPEGRVSVVIRALPWRAGGGKVHGLVVQVQDVTERLRTRGELALTAASSEAVLQLSHESVHTLDGAGRVIDVNPAACALAGASGPAPFLGCRFEELVAPISRPEVLAALEAAQSGEPATFRYWLNATSGRTIEASAQAIAILDSGGRPSRYVVVSREACETGS